MLRALQNKVTLLRSHCMAACLAFFLMAAVVGYLRMPYYITNNDGCDQLSYTEALEMAKGKHHAGIVGYTHYPNGPAYVLVPFIKMGITKFETLKYVPIVISALGLAIGCSILLFWANSVASVLAVISGFLVLLAQPAISDWMSSVHHQPYVLVVVLVTCAVALNTKSFYLWSFIFGWFAGWFSYDFIPTQVGATFISRLLVHRAKNTNLRAMKLAVIDTSLAVAGVIAAVFAHFYQIKAYYAGLDFADPVGAAVSDFLGSAATRLGLVSDAKNMSPEYQERIYSSLPAVLSMYGMSELPGPFGMVLFMAKKFLESFARPWMLLIWATGAVVWTAVIMRRLSGAVKVSYVQLWFLIAVVAFLGVAAWPMVMKMHVIFHTFFIPRSFIVPFYLLLMTVVISWKHLSHHQQAK